MRELKNNIIGIDTGPLTSGIIHLQAENVGWRLAHCNDKMVNGDICGYLVEKAHFYSSIEVVVEHINARGQLLNQANIDMVHLIGWINKTCIEVGMECHLITNRLWKSHLCGANNASAKEVKIASKQILSPYGGGSDPYKGVKNQPGPIYGISSHCWSALGVCAAHITGCKPHKLIWKNVEKVTR